MIMTKPTSSLIIFCILLLLPFQETHCQGTQPVQTNGEVPIIRDSEGLYIRADFRDRRGSQTDNFSDVGKFLVALYSSDTMLSSTCQDFRAYRCATYNCQVQGASPAVSYNSFVASIGSRVKGELYLDYNFWSLQNTAIYPTKCDANFRLLPLGTSRTGIIGMGTKDNSALNFLKNNYFGIYLNKDLTGGSLLFKMDSMDMSLQNPLVTLPVDPNWRATTLTYGNFSLDSKSQYSTTFNLQGLMFDMNIEEIGLPKSVYDTLLSYLSNFGTFNSSIYNTPYLPKFKPKTSLPTITFRFNNYYTIEVPPRIYVKYSTSRMGFLTLNLKALSEYLDGDAYAPAASSGFIVFGQSFMRYYFTIFQENQIKLYYSNYTKILDGEGFKWSAQTLMYIGIPIGVIVLGVIIYCCCKKKRSSSNEFDLLHC